MVIHLYTLCWNEMDILPFVIDYWKKIPVTKAVVYDNGSTDGSIEYLQQFDWIEVRHFETNGMNDFTQKDIKNKCWKESKGVADYVIVCDMDECLFLSDGIKTFEYMKNNGYTICLPQWYDFISEEIPIYTEGKLLHEISQRAYKGTSKCVLFDPNKINDINYTVGAHQHSPKGEIKYYTVPNIYILHINHHLSLEYLLNRYKRMDERLSNENKRSHLCIHYSFSEERLRKDYENSLKNSINFNELVNSKIKVALCCIGRLENKYAKEFVEYYKELGFDKIFIYDNNYDGEEHFEDVLEPYVTNGFVEIIDYRNKQKCQMQAYTDCYLNHGNEYDWIAFFDFDEYLTINGENSIKEFLSDKAFDNFQGIHINWMIYDDNDLIKYENKPLLERFTRPIEYDKCITYNFPENNHVKSIIRGGLNGFNWNIDTHSPHMNLLFCNNIGEKCNDEAFSQYNFDKCYLKHFRTKTIEEYLSNKMERGFADRTYEDFLKKYGVDFFFKVNTKTKEKEDFIKEYLRKEKPNLDIFIGTYKTFNVPVSNSAYNIIVGNHEIENNSNLKLIKCKYDSILDDTFFSETYMLKCIAENYQLKDYVGYCHYRKYFNFMDDIPDMDEMFSKYDAIVGKPIIYKTRTIKQDYGACHNIEDLYIVGGIIADKYPSYSQSWHNFINGNILIPYNMFIMKSEDFKEYIKFIFDVLDEYLKIVGTDIRKRIEDNKEKYLKRTYPNNTVDYQYRIGGYISERLTNLFIMTHFKRLRTYPIIVTENKYTQKKDNSK